MPEIDELKTNFLILTEKFSDKSDVNLNRWNEIVKNYCKKSRYYHNLKHLNNIFSELKRAENLIQNPDSVTLAVFYHDLIYCPLRNDNEYKSANLFENRFAETSFTAINQVKAMIIATEKHQLSADSDTNLFLDADLSILGKPNKIYDKYAIDIRKEYGIIPDVLYNNGRKKTLESFINQEFIYKTDIFRDRYEFQAKRNINRELKQYN